MVGLLVHEWVESAGGAENVLDQFVALFPDADLQVLWTDAPDRYAVPTYETWLASTPLRRHKALALPFQPFVWRSLRARQKYDWLLVSSHLFAHHVRPRGLDADVPKFVYAHTPARYVWAPGVDRRGAGIAARAASIGLRPLDRKRSHEATEVAANSEYTRRRIQQAWQRDAIVIYPPVDTERIISGGEWANHVTTSEQELLGSLPSEYLLGASRFVPYKRLDLVIRAGEATGLPVVLAGGGPQREELRALADRAATPVFLVDFPSDSLLFALFQRAVAYVFPAIEDFGIMPVEAMAAGTPVIVSQEGGAAESVNLLQGGAIADLESASGWREALSEISHIERSALPGRTSRLSATRFRAEISRWLESVPARRESSGGPSVPNVSSR